MFWCSMHTLLTLNNIIRSKKTSAGHHSREEMHGRLLEVRHVCRNSIMLTDGNKG